MLVNFIFYMPTGSFEFCFAYSRLKDMRLTLISLLLLLLSIVIVKDAWKSMQHTSQTLYCSYENALFFFFLSMIEFLFLTISSFHVILIWLFVYYLTYAMF